VITTWCPPGRGLLDPGVVAPSCAAVKVVSCNELIDTERPLCEPEEGKEETTFVPSIEMPVTV
jgi:hypothetical protein